ncbi:MAG: hypothetical protein K2Y22_04500 [Candidatus Obscuribacterales bacterium]|nr:hypothetical protein [Candidatus Obscuribacterales bacterium]
MDTDLGNQILSEMHSGFNRLDNRIDSLQLDISGLRTDMSREFSNVQEEMANNMMKVDAEFSNVRRETGSGFNRLDNRIDNLRDLMKSDISGLRATMANNVASVRAEMAAGFSKQEQLSNDIIETMVKSIGTYSTHVDNRFKEVHKDIAILKGLKPQG